MNPTVSDTVKRQRLAGYFGFGLSAVIIAIVLAIGFTQKQPDTFTVQFDIGTVLRSDADAAIDAAIARLAEEPTAIAVVTGHTGTAGDLEANHQLSKSRAEAVAEMLLAAGMREDRIIVLGAAGKLPAERDEGMSDAAYERSLPRVVIAITERTLFSRPER